MKSPSLHTAVTYFCVDMSFAQAPREILDWCFWGKEKHTASPPSCTALSHTPLPNVQSIHLSDHSCKMKILKVFYRRRMLSFDLPALSVLICSFPSVNAHLEAESVCNCWVQAPSQAQAGDSLIRYYLKWAASSVTGCMRRMAADGNARCTWTWSTGHLSPQVCLKQGKNKSSWRATTTG